MSAAPKAAALFMRRTAAGKYLNERFGFGGPNMLAKLAITGDGPIMHKYGTRVVLYRAADIDAWVLERVGASRQSTSDDVSALVIQQPSGNRRAEQHA